MRPSFIGGSGPGNTRLVEVNVFMVTPPQMSSRLFGDSWPPYSARITRTQICAWRTRNHWGRKGRTPAEASYSWSSLLGRSVEFHYEPGSG